MHILAPERVSSSISTTSTTMRAGGTVYTTAPTCNATNGLLRLNQHLTTALFVAFGITSYSFEIVPNLCPHANDAGLVTLTFCINPASCVLTPPPLPLSFPMLADLPPEVWIIIFRYLP